MDKKRLFRIMARADKRDLSRLAEEIQQRHSVSVVKEPGKTLAMIKLREPVKESLFYLGEVIVCEAVVELDGVKGIAVTMGDDMEKTLSMATVDAAVNKGVFCGMEALLDMEKAQNDLLMRENALHLKTMVNFESMDREVPKDVSAFKKA
jgi:alpha-D-ribose 1-methylphosphonate 5-triphosphate synthase subunit PhnG